MNEGSPDVDTEQVANAVEEMLPLLTRLARLHVIGDAEVGVVIEQAWLDTLRSMDGDQTSLRGRVVRSLLRRLTESGIRPVPANGANPRRDPGNSGTAHVHADRFLPPSHPRWPGHWADPPRHPRELSVLARSAAATWSFVRATLRTIPAQEAEVLLLRDVERWNAAEVCETLGVADAEQRALLHSGRERVRRALEDYPGRN